MVISSWSDAKYRIKERAVLEVASLRRGKELARFARRSGAIVSSSFLSRLRTFDSLEAEARRSGGGTGAARESIHLGWIELDSRVPKFPKGTAY